MQSLILVPALLPLKALTTARFTDRDLLRCRRLCSECLDDDDADFKFFNPLRLLRLLSRLLRVRDDTRRLTNTGVERGTTASAPRPFRRAAFHLHTNNRRSRSPSPLKVIPITSKPSVLKKLESVLLTGAALEAEEDDAEGFTVDDEFSD